MHTHNYVIFSDMDDCTYIISLTVPYRSYKFFIYAATIAGEGPLHDGEFLTREDSK